MQLQLSGYQLMNAKKNIQRTLVIIRLLVELVNESSPTCGFLIQLLRRLGLYGKVSQIVDHDPKLGRETLSSGLRKKFETSF